MRLNIWIPSLVPPPPPSCAGGLDPSRAEQMGWAVVLPAELMIFLCGGHVELSKVVLSRRSRVWSGIARLSRYPDPAWRAEFSILWAFWRDAMYLLQVPQPKLEIFSHIFYIFSSLSIVCYNFFLLSLHRFPLFSSILFFFHFWLLLDDFSCLCSSSSLLFFYSFHFFSLFLYFFRTLQSSSFSLFFFISFFLSTYSSFSLFSPLQS